MMLAQASFSQDCFVSFVSKNSSGKSDVRSSLEVGNRKSGRMPMRSGIRTVMLVLHVHVVGVFVFSTTATEQGPYSDLDWRSRRSAYLLGKPPPGRERLFMRFSACQHKERRNREPNGLLVRCAIVSTRRVAFTFDEEKGGGR
jgi:hypothetical protein